MRRLLPAAIVLTMALSGHAGAPDPDRSADYIGSAYVNHGLNPTWVPTCEAVFGQHDCPTPVPTGIMSTYCDTDSWGGLGMHQGFGGVMFCAIPQRSTIRLSIHDDHIEAPLARITCAGVKEIPFPHLGDIRASGTVHVPRVTAAGEYCVPAWNEPLDTTRVYVWLHGPPDGPVATRGSVHLHFLPE